MGQHCHGSDTLAQAEPPTHSPKPAHGLPPLWCGDSHTHPRNSHIPTAAQPSDSTGVCQPCLLHILAEALARLGNLPLACLKDEKLWQGQGNGCHAGLETKRLQPHARGSNLDWSLNLRIPIQDNFLYRGVIRLTV
jgi:hypothetical protein